MSRSAASSVTSSSTSFALDVAAPSLRRDGDAPWTGAPAANGEAGLAAMFWVSFHGLSVFIHTVLITLSVAGPMFLAIVPIPFIAAMCSEVKHVEKPIERVEMAIVEMPRAPPLAEPPPPEAEPVKANSDKGAVKVAKLTRREARIAQDDLVTMGVLGLVATRSDDSAQLSAIFGSSGTPDDNVFGGLIGTEVSESFGAGGLGLKGIGAGGGGTNDGVIGLGTIGTIGVVGRNGDIGGSGRGYGVGGGAKREARRVRVALDELSAAARARLERLLTACNVGDVITGTVTVVDDVPTEISLSPRNACASRMVQRTFFDAEGTFALTISPVTP